MRNLWLSSSAISTLSNGRITATAADIDTDSILIAAESQNSDEVDIEIWKRSSNDGSSLITLLSSNGRPGTAPQIVSFHIIAETHQLAVILRGGDIAMISLDEKNPMAEVEGTVEAGILAASWSPDDSLLALVTSEDKLILMTSTFDVLSESPLHTTDFGEDEQINVGWGSKQTQFHGSLGKTAAQAPSTAQIIGSSPDDDTIPRVSWRGDGAFFVVSALDRPVNSMQRRSIRVYDRAATLQSTSEPVAGLEHVLAWRPSGNLIASTQRFGSSGLGAGKDGRHDVVFFERNGLKHGEFEIGLRCLQDHIAPKETADSKGTGYRIKELSFSSDSNVLAIWVEGINGDFLQLWTTGNYHWYLKQEIHAPNKSRFTSLAWHPEEALRILLTTQDTVIDRTYIWSTCSAPNASGSVAVFDGASILLTPFRTQNIPPPMSAHNLTLSSPPTTSKTPIYATFSSSITLGVPPTSEVTRDADILTILWETGHIEIWALNTRLGPGKGKIMDPKMAFSIDLADGENTVFRQVGLSQQSEKSPLTLHALSSTSSVDFIVSVAFFDVDGVVTTKEKQILQLPSQNGRLVASSGGKHLFWQARDGAVLQVNLTESNLKPIAKFPEFCFVCEPLVVPALVSEQEEDKDERLVFIGFAASGKLYATSSRSASHMLVGSGVTSVTLASGFVIFTSTTHDATFAPVADLVNRLVQETLDTDVTLPLKEWERRRLERGSRIVVAIPSMMSLVLQMPRGNLETIHPRPLVMEVVKGDLDDGNYRKAFFACRKHRIDLSILVDHDRSRFLQQISTFVEQVHEVEHLNIFLANLGRAEQPPEMIAELCDALRINLESRDITKYVNSILTAYVVKTPPDHEAGLTLLLRIRDTRPHIVEDAVKYIIFLVDADRLFDTALGMYDFALVLMIAQYAQKDPREYMPFLRELRALDKHYQRFKIDDHLRRHEKALKHLSLAGAERFAEALTYVEQHQLYDVALLTWKGTDQHGAILSIYGDWLFERREFRQAALVFREAGALSKAMVAHEKAHEWQELFDLAFHLEMSPEDLAAVACRVAEDLVSKKRYADAGRVLLDYAKNVREAVIALVQGNHFSEARRLASLNTMPELMEDIIRPGSLDSCSQIADDITEIREQLRKQVVRIRELRVRKIEEPDAFYGTEDSNLHNIDVMTDVSMPATAFTRYTVAPTNTSRSSKRTSRSKRKLERKAGRKGTVDEEEYLLRSLTKLVARFCGTREEAKNLLPHLLQFGEEHIQEALSLQTNLGELEMEIGTSIEEVWIKVSTDSEPTVDSFASRMEEREKNSLVNPTERVSKPEILPHDWKVRLLSAA